MTDLQITLHLEAPTPVELSALTVQAQLNWNLQLSFFDFTQTKKGTYICWYKVPHSLFAERIANGQT